MMQNRIVRLLILVVAWSVVVGVVINASLKHARVIALAQREANLYRSEEAISRLSDGVYSERDIKPRLPKCLIIGFSKCGTLALRGFMSLHPDIISPKREISYFNQFYNRGIFWYKNQMPFSSPDQITIEKTPGYIMSLENLERIYQFNSTIKLVIIVRDPIQKLQSEYAHFFSYKTDIQDKPTFEEWCEHNAHSEKVQRIIDYASHVRDVYSLFPKDQVLVLNEADLESNPLRVMKEVEGFLGLRRAFTKHEFVFNKNKGFYCFNTTSPRYAKILESVVLNERTGCLGKGKGRQHPDVEESFLKELVTAIRPYNQRLFHMIGKTFRWENFSI